MRNTKNFKNNELDSNFSYHRWIWYVYGYLSLARMGVEKLKKENRPPATITSLENYFSYRKKYLLIPIIYNIKHAIEIIYKALKVQVDVKYIRSHNIIDLSKAVKESIEKLGLTIKSTELDELAIIAEKYFKLKIFNKKVINATSIFDSQNDIFRFPNDILNSEKLNEVSKKEINEFLIDIKKLNQLLCAIKESIQKTKIF